MSEDPLLGTLLADRYRVDRLIGEGAMGRVYLAEHIHMRKQVALKVLHPELMTVPEIVQRFEREARAAAHIEHPHVAAATDFGKLATGNIYLVLEFVEGVPLSQVIEGGPMSVPRVLLIAAQAASALVAAHARGIVHRDLKPDNLLLVRAPVEAGEEAEDFLKVLDFGIAKVPADAHGSGKPITQVGMVYGTPEYMSPEQALGQEVDGRTDLYALGVIMFEMLAGRRPYVGPIAGLLGQQLATPIPKINSVSKARVPMAVEALVVDLLATDVKQRVASAEDALSQLEALKEAYAAGKLSGGGGASSLLSVSFDDVSTRIETVRQSIPQPVKRAIGSRLSRAVFLALGFGAVGVFGAIFLVGAFVKDPSPPPKKFELTEPPPPVLEVPDESPAIEEELSSAKKQGIGALLSLVEKYPTEGSVREELSLAQAKATRYEDAVDSARIALALDPNLNESKKIKGALYRAAQSKEARASAFRLLRGAMGPAGVRIIYDLSRMKDVSPQVKSYAESILNEAEVRAAASPALSLVLDLEKVEDCKKAHAMVERAALVADDSALAALERLGNTDGCGPKKSDDCFPCLRSSKVLENAISSIKARTPPDDVAE